MSATRLHGAVPSPLRFSLLRAESCTEQRTLVAGLAWVVHCAGRRNHGRCIQRMCVYAPLAQDMSNPGAAGHQCVRNQLPMAAPRHRLRAHQCRCSRLCRVQHLPERRLEAGAVHVIGICTKAFVPPEQVVRRPFARPPPAQIRQVRVPDPQAAQRSTQIFSIELRLPARAWKTANVQDQVDSGRTQQCGEFIERPGRVPDREYRSHLAS